MSKESTVTDGKALEEAINEAGVTITHIARTIGCSRNRIYAILGGSDCTAREICGFSQVLHLSRDKRDDIFLPNSVN